MFSPPLYAKKRNSFWISTEYKQSGVDHNSSFVWDADYCLTAIFFEIRGGEISGGCLHYVGADISEAEAREEAAGQLLIFTACLGEIWLGEVHEGIGTIQASLAPGRELIPACQSEDQHNFSGIFL